MINTTSAVGVELNDVEDGAACELDKTQDGGDQASGMPSQFQLYSELTARVFGNATPVDLQYIDGNERRSETDSSFEFDVAADDIYDLTFF